MKDAIDVEVCDRGWVGEGTCGGKSRFPEGNHSVHTVAPPDTVVYLHVLNQILVSWSFSPPFLRLCLQPARERWRQITVHRHRHTHADTKRDIHITTFHTVLQTCMLKQFNRCCGRQHPLLGRPNGSASRLTLGNGTRELMKIDVAHQYLCNSSPHLSFCSLAFSHTCLQHHYPTYFRSNGTD